ncbi:MAG: PorT family protein [Clostridium sp.]|nr:PorT family protein [Bacteroides sp.]MCM1198795.1 PorT family protein [Clostridium sp.]
MKRIIYILIGLMLPLTALKAQENQINVGGILVDTASVVITDAYLDSVDFKKKTLINDYTLIGVHYGVGLNQVTWNPPRKQGMQFVPVNFGVTWTRYGKMFGYMPYFGIQAGLFYAKEGYQLDEGYNEAGARNALMDVVEVPVLAHCHFDFWKMKLMVNIGFYGAYRLSISRWGGNVHESIKHDFLATDRRFDYGIKGGAGFGFVFDPVEIHFNAMYKYGFGSLFQPNYESEYYYRFANVSNFIFSVSLHFQITKRIGKTNHELRKEAKRLFDERRHAEGIRQNQY